jgi:hypothetical protein
LVIGIGLSGNSTHPRGFSKTHITCSLTCCDEIPWECVQQFGGLSELEPDIAMALNLISCGAAILRHTDHRSTFPVVDYLQETQT